MALQRSSFLNFEEVKSKEYDKKLIIISPSPTYYTESDYNTSGVGQIVGFLDEVPRISASANWKSYSEMLGDAVGGIDKLKDTVAAVTGNTSFMYGDWTAKFFTGGGEFSFDTGFRCISYTPWNSKYEGIAKPITLDGKQYLIGDCRKQFNNIFAMCFPKTTEILESSVKTLTNFASGVGGALKSLGEANGTISASKGVFDNLMAGFVKNQPTVSVQIGNGNVNYFNSNKMIIKSVNSQYSEEWVKLNNNTEPVPMYVDITVTLELAQLAGLSDMTTSEGAITINFK